MNTLRQLESGLLASKEAVKDLAKAENAKILIVSDTHGHYEILEEILKNHGSDCDAFCFAGDGMWDLIQFIENALDSEKLAEFLPPVVAFVAGNGDGDQYRVLLPNSQEGDSQEGRAFNIFVPHRQILKACGYGIFLTHGHRYSVDVSLDILADSAHALDCDIAVFGHTHILLVEEYSHITLINPGSPTRPRGRSEASFAILEVDASLTSPKVELYTIPKKFFKLKNL